jgi:hypothetical protein
MVPEESEEEGEAAVAPAGAVDYVDKHGLVVCSFARLRDRGKGNYNGEGTPDVQE